MFNAKEHKLEIQNMQIDYISFGKGTKSLIMIQGLNTNGIEGPDLVNKLVLAVTLSKNNAMVESVVENWIILTQKGAIKQLVMDMAEKSYSDAYLKRYKPFMPLLTVMQKPKDFNKRVYDFLKG